MTPAAIRDYLTIAMAVAAITMHVIMLTSCGSPESSNFDEWYEQVINEPYDPLNGSKY